MKDTNEVIDEFNDIVNMTASELEKWLKSGDSRSAGWPKDEDGGESVGHDSGRRIVEILKSNPDKDPEKYTDDQLSHMRKVVSYCKRHLAQEEKMIQEKSTEEVKETKSYASLKNWGHDPLKKYGDGGEDGEEEEDEEKEDADDANEEEQEDDNEEDEQAGDKRKKSTKDQSGSNKKRETRQGQAKSNGKDESDEDEEVVGDKEEEEDDDEEEEDENKENGKPNGDGKEGSAKNPKNGPKPGDTVSWNWGNGQPQGKVLDVKGEKTTVTTKRGNEVSRDGDPEDPAVVLDTGKSKAIKSNHELVD